MINPKVSIIVAVYRAEKHLHRCIDSILAQTMPDFELLLIDDGSPDRSGAICDEYAAKDSRIRVFHQENGGVATARQLGIDNACGEYSIQADSDDWIEPVMLDELYKYAKKEHADMVIADLLCETRYGQQYMKQEPVITDSCRELLKQLILGEIHGSTCNKLVLTSLYKKFGICIPSNMKYMEDTFLNCCLLMHDIKVKYLPKAYYHYDTIEDNCSITSHGRRIISRQNLDCLIFFTDYFSSILPKDDFEDVFVERKIFIKSLMWYGGHYKREEFINKYKEVNKQILREYKQGKHQGKRQFVYALNGYYFPMKALNMFRKVLN